MSLIIPALVMWLTGLALICLLFPRMTGCSLQGGTSIQGNGTAPPQGTASTSSLQNLSTPITGAAGISLAFGTGANQINIIVAQDRTLAATTAETLDLWGATTPLDDIFGAAALFRHIKYIAIYTIPPSGDIAGLQIGNAASDPFVGPLGGTTPTALIYPNGPGWQIGEPTAGWAVTALAGQLKINNLSAVPTTYRIVIGGVNV